MLAPSRPVPPTTTSLEVRRHLVDALELDLVGPSPGHPRADECLGGWIRPSNWYLTGFLIPSTTPPEQRGDADEDDDLGEVPQVAGLAEEDNEERKAAKKGYFPSSMGLSFLVAPAARSLSVAVRWGDYAPGTVTGPDDKPVAVWQRTPREEVIDLDLPAADGEVVRDVAQSDGLQLHAVLRTVDSRDLAEQLPAGTRSVSVFLVNHRAPVSDPKDEAAIGTSIGRSAAYSQPSRASTVGASPDAGPERPRWPPPARHVTPPRHRCHPSWPRRPS
jgi:hypothetical protein